MAENLISLMWRSGQLGNHLPTLTIPNRVFSSEYSLQLIHSIYTYVIPALKVPECLMNLSFLRERFYDIFEIRQNI